MGDYLENNKKWEWKVSDDKAIIEVDHGDHYHNLDVSQIPASEFKDNANQYLGDAHRAAGHDWKDEDEDEYEDEDDDEYEEEADDDNEKDVDDDSKDDDDVKDLDDDGYSV